MFARKHGCRLLGPLSIRESKQHQDVVLAWGEPGGSSAEVEEVTMKKIINEPLAVVDEMLEGLLLAHPQALRTAGSPRAIVRADAPVKGKVALATGGGSG